MRIILSLVLIIFTACSQFTPQDRPTEPPEKPQPPDEISSPGINNTDLPLEVPEGFEISEFATGLSGARDLVGPDKLGNYWLSRTSEGIVTLITLDEEGNLSSTSDVFVGLNKPHGLELDPQDPFTLYIAEFDRVSKVELYTEGELQKIADLPTGERHFTRSLHFGPDDRLYVSIGSSCDVCIETDERLATVYVMDKNGENFEQYATGLRNAVFLDTEPVYGDIWVTEMGRDHLGDNLPPDEVNILEESGDYGWPYCYGDKVRDDHFQPSEKQDYCQQTISAHVELPAHSAPLGLAFVPEEGWPEEMALDLLVAYHGSWNRSEPTGYKIARIDLDQDRNPLGTENFISGWLTEDDQKLGRPVDLLIQPGGILFITDDRRGVIYKVNTTSTQN